MTKGSGFGTIGSVVVGAAVAIVITGGLAAIQTLWDKLKPKRSK